MHSFFWEHSMTDAFNCYWTCRSNIIPLPNGVWCCWGSGQTICSMFLQGTITMVFFPSDLAYIHWFFAAYNLWKKLSRNLMIRSIHFLTRYIQWKNTRYKPNIYSSLGGMLWFELSTSYLQCIWVVMAWPMHSWVLDISAVIDIITFVSWFWYRP